MSWDLDIEQASFRGIEFDVVSVRDTLGRRFAVHEYPNRNGAEIDDLGRQPRPTEVEAILRGPEYLSDLGALMQIADEGESGNFQHPLLGSWTARIERLDIQHSHDRRDEVAIAIALREDGVGTDLPDVFSITAAKDEVESASTAVTTQAAADGVTTGNATENLATDATNMVDDVDANESDLSNRLTQLTTFVREAITEIESAGTDVETIETVTAARKIALKGKQLKERVERLQPSVISYEVSSHTSASILALALYGDADRSTDLLRLNRILNPFVIPPGTTLRVFDR